MHTENLAEIKFTIPDTERMTTEDWGKFGRDIGALPGLKNFDIESVFTGGEGKVMVDPDKLAEVRSKIEALGLKISE